MSIEPAKDISYKDADRVLKLNTLAPMILFSLLFDLIKKNSADIVNVSSTVGWKAYECQAAYGTSKWAMCGLTENLQLELKDTPCRVIGFNPGGFKSRIFKPQGRIWIFMNLWSLMMLQMHLSRLLSFQRIWKSRRS